MKSFVGGASARGTIKASSCTSYAILPYNAGCYSCNSRYLDKSLPSSDYIHFTVCSDCVKSPRVKKLPDGSFGIDFSKKKGSSKKLSC